MRSKYKSIILSIIIFTLGYEASQNDFFPINQFFERHFAKDKTPEALVEPTPVQAAYYLYSDVSNKQSVECPTPDNTFVVATFGQSNAANGLGQKFVDETESIINFFNGYCYLASDPTLGAAGEQGSIWIPFLQQLNVEKTILSVNFAVGGSSINRWLNSDDLGQVLSENMQALADSDYKPDLFMWFQGESEAYKDASVFEERLETLISRLETDHPTAAIGISGTTYCNQRIDKNIVNVQKRVALSRDHIWLGSTDDFISLQHRYDDCHLSGLGATEVATMFANSVNNYLQKNAN